MNFTSIIKIRCIFCILFFISAATVTGQTFATTITDQNEVDLPNNAIDQNLTTSAQIRASSGAALGFGSYDGYLELQFSSPLAPNSTSYIRLDTEEDLLSSLVGGSLGDLLSQISGTLLMGSQDFTVQALNGTTTVLEGSSTSAADFGADNLRVVTDVNNDYYIAITPNAQYNRLRLTNNVDAILGFNTLRDLDVYGAFHTEGMPPTCGAPTYTSYTGTGITLDLLSMGSAGAIDPHLSIDSDLNTNSTLGLGILNAEASIEQTFYFDSPATSNENFYVKLAISPALFQAGLGNNVDLITQDGAETPIFTSDLANVLESDDNVQLNAGQPVTIAVDPGVGADRLSIRLSTLLGISLDQHLEIFEVYRAPVAPEIDPASQDTYICYNTTADLVANSDPGNELRWYDSETGGTLLATTNPGETFTTPALTMDTTFYVSAAQVGCPQESFRTPVTVHVVDIPTATDIQILGASDPICSSSAITLVPTSSIDGTFHWYFDANATNEITNRLVLGGATYTIGTDGTLTITGLDQTGSPYTFYAGIEDALAGCENVPGDLASASVTVVDSATSANITSNPVISLQELIDFFQNGASYMVSGAVSGDASPGNGITLTINGTNYTGVLDGSLNFDILVDGTDLALDSDGIIQAYLNGSICTVTDEILISLPTLSIDPTAQTFCASDAPTLADFDVNGLPITFYSSATLNTTLPMSTALTDGGTYYAGIDPIPAQVLARVAMTSQLLDVPTPTSTSQNQLFCTTANATIADIQVNESNVVFYATASATTALDPSTVVTDGATYFVAATNASGCESTTRLAITVQLSNTIPVVITEDGNQSCLNQSSTYTSASGKQNYNWIVVGGSVVDGGGPTDDFATVVWTRLQDTSISLSYTDPMGCTATSPTQLPIAVTDCGEILGDEFCLQVYNEFTPNNDGANDYFKIECIESYPNNLLRIFDRYGSMVFQSRSYQNNWHGVANVSGPYNGQVLPTGTYFYTLKIDDLGIDRTGWVYIRK